MRRRALAALVAVAALAFGPPAPAQTSPPAPSQTAVAIFAGGCFWCMEPPFDALDGVTATISGYTGGMRLNPTYEQVSTGVTGHAEAVKVEYDPSKVSYEKLLYVFWRNVDPLTSDAQFCDHGTQYRTAIFASDDEQLRLAQESKEALEKSGRFKRPIVTQIVRATQFWPAEDYHQDYYRKNPVRYQFYRAGCGRDDRLRQLWGDEAGGGAH